MKKGRGRIIFRWAIALLCVIAVIGLMFFKFSFDIRKDVVAEIEKEMKQTTEKYALGVRSDLESIAAAGKTAAQLIGQQNDTSAMQQILAALVDQTQLHEAIYCDEKGMAVNQDGTTYDLEGAAYVETKEQYSKVEYVYKSNDGVSGEDAIMIIVPVPEEKGNLFLLYSMDRVKTLIKVDGEFGQAAFSVMADKSGNVFSYEDIESNFVKFGNIWRNIDRKYLSASTQIRVAIQTLSTGSVVLAAGGEKRTLAYAPIGIGDFSLVIGVQQNYVEYAYRQALLKMFFMMIQLLCVVALFFGIYLISNAISKKKSEKNSKTLEEKADTDLLTGLNNKLATERKIKEYIRDYPDSLAMMFILDIDNFKKINDTLGHVFGDEVLRTLGKRIGVNFRVTDILGRTGGDEFTIFLKDLKEDANTLKEAQKLINFFKDFQVGDYVKYSPTASIGAAVFPADGKDFESLYKNADQALYKAKKRGKNQLAFFDDRDRTE